MPALPQQPNLPHPPDDGSPLARWAGTFVGGFLRHWRELIYTLNSLSLVDTLANRSSEPGLDHALFTASDTGQTFIGISGAWTTLPRDGGLNTTQVGTDADTAEKDLMTDSVPANVLDVNGRTVFMEAWGTFANNANTKMAGLVWGATKIAITDAYTNVAWHLHVRAMRTATDAQDLLFVALVSGTSPTVSVTTATADDGAAVSIKVVGQNGVASANDVVAHGFRWWVGGR